MHNMHNEETIIILIDAAKSITVCYLFLSLVLFLMMICLNYENVKRMSSFKLTMLYFTLPFLWLRESLHVKKKG